MNDARWELDVAPTTAEMLEAMVGGGRALVRGRNRALVMVINVFVCLLAPVGATLLLWVVVHLAGGPDIADLPVAAVPLTFMGFVAGTVWLTMQPYVMMANISAGSRFGRRYRAILDRDGLSLETAHSTWRTGWADVAVVHGGKTTLAIGISGIAIPIPHRVFAEPQDAATALACAQRWQEAAQ
jgi:hypothetical protein